MKYIKFLLYIIVATIIVTSFPQHSLATVWKYTISPSDTTTTIDSVSTDAVVDTSSNSIYLPFTAPSSVSFWPDGEKMDYVVAAPGKIIHYSFDHASSKMAENTVLNVSLPSNPLAVAAPSPYPDVVAVTDNKMYHYSFTGTGMVENPVLEAAGLAGAVAVGANSSNVVAGVVPGQVKSYQFDIDTNSMVEMPSMEPIALTNPLAIALNPDNYDMAVLDAGQVKYYNYSGSSMVQNPALTVTGLSNPKAIASAGGNDLVVVDGNQVKHFSFNGSSMSYNVALSVTSGLVSPSCVAVRPGYYDRIIVDGDQVKYYQWDGSKLVYNENLSVTVSGLSKIGSYVSSAVVVSKTFTPPGSVDNARVLASIVAPADTSVTWYITADGGTNWTASWRVRGTSTGTTVCEVTPDNGKTWSAIGDASVALPDSNNENLWTKVNPGTNLKWKAVLSTSNRSVTPKIAASIPGNTAVQLDSNSAPLKPELPTYGTCFTTTTPTLTWQFNDPDPGDTQFAYQVQIYKASDVTGGNPKSGAIPVIDSGKVVSAELKYNVPTSTTASQPGPLWLSGTYQFAYRVMTWDQGGLSSPWSNCSAFCVVGFERPRIGKIELPPSDQIAPVPTNLSTYIMIQKGMTAEQLPKAKAGAMVNLVFDTIGPINDITSLFPYTGPQGDQLASISIPDTQPDGVTPNPTKPVGSETNRWTIGFYTNPSLKVCPTGTVVKMQLSGSGAGVLSTLNAPPWAAGVIQTKGSVYNDVVVVLQGRD